MAFSGVFVFGAESYGLLAWRDAWDSNSRYRSTTRSPDAHFAFDPIADHKQCRDRV